MNIRKGFTLVEMLIVIVVMGILSSMMMMSSSESISTANVGTIISNLQNISLAALSFYTDSLDYYRRNPNDNIPYERVLRYTQAGLAFPNSGDYLVKNNNGTWWAGYKVGDNKALQNKLTGRAGSAMLRGAQNTENDDNASPTNDEPYSGHKKVWMRIRTSNP